MSDINARDFMTTDLATVNPEQSLADVWEIIENRHIRHVPVVDKSNNLVGMVSHRDLVRTALHDDLDLPVTERQDLLAAIKVEAAMVKEVESVSPEMDITEVGELMLENKFSSVPVVEGQELVGIITEADFVRWVVENA